MGSMDVVCGCHGVVYVDGCGCGCVVVEFNSFSNIRLVDLKAQLMQLATEEQQLWHMSEVLDRNTGPQHELTEIIPKTLFLSGLGPALDPEGLQKRHITHIINLCLDPLDCDITAEFYGSSFHWIGIEAQDDDDYDILQHLPLVLEYIEEAKQADGAVLVHCAAGINRSGTLVVAAYMSLTGTKLFDALKRIKAVRSHLIVNDAFRLKLLRWATAQSLL